MRSSVGVDRDSHFLFRTGFRHNLGRYVSPMFNVQADEHGITNLYQRVINLMREKELDAASLNRLNSLGKSIGPPWTQDQKYATAAALLVTSRS